MTGQITDLANTEQITQAMDEALGAGNFRNALLCRLLLARSTVLRLFERTAKAQTAAGDGSKAIAADDQMFAVAEAAHWLYEHIERLEERITTHEISNEEAHSMLLCFHLATAQVFGDMAEMGWSGSVAFEKAFSEAQARSGLNTTEAARAERDKLHTAYKALRESEPTLTPKQIAAKLHEQFPDRKLDGILATVYRWQRGH